MKNLKDEILISEINIPGTHDAAAINSSIATLYACQNLTITKQLEAGIRLLDVRLKVCKDGDGFNFMTCHGPIGSTLGINTYQSFSSLMDECEVFLSNYSSEAIILTLKVDDWYDAKGCEDRAYSALKTLLKTYPILSKKEMPTLSEIRGKIFLYNRINSDLDLGVPIEFPENKYGDYVDSSNNRAYKVYVQDRFNGLSLINSEADKYQTFIDAIGKKKEGEVLFNYASAVWYGVFGIYIQDRILNYFGSQTANYRPATFGWTMMDKPTTMFETNKYSYINLVQIIISSNYSYQGYEEDFFVTP